MTLTKINGENSLVNKLNTHRVIRALSYPWVNKSLQNIYRSFTLYLGVETYLMSRKF